VPYFKSPGGSALVDPHEEGGMPKTSCCDTKTQRPFHRHLFPSSKGIKGLPGRGSRYSVVYQKANLSPSHFRKRESLSGGGQTKDELLCLNFPCHVQGNVIKKKLPNTGRVAKIHNGDKSSIMRRRQDGLGFVISRTLRRSENRLAGYHS